MEYVRIYIYIYRDRRTQLASVGLAQACPNNIGKFEIDLNKHVCVYDCVHL